MKKLLSILMLLVAIVTGASADPTPALPAGTLTLPTIPTTGWKGDVTPNHYKAENSNVYVFSPYELYKSTQTWETHNAVGSSGSATSTAVAPFPAGSTAFTGLTPAAVKTSNAKGPYAYRVTNCIAAYALVQSGSNKKRTVQIEVFEVENGVESTTAVGQDETESNDATVIKVTGLSATKEYCVRVSQKSGSGSAGSSSGNSTFHMIGFEMPASLDPALSISPEEANAFTYVAGEGPSAAQAFTVSLANSTKAVSATLSSTNYEMSKTEDGEYSSDAIADLANGSKVYVRLKAGLAKGTGYDGTLTFANDDVTDDVVVNLSGSVTGQTYTVDYELNGGSGTASQDPAEAGDVITLAAAPTKDFTNFAGWLCSADDQVYEAGAAYTMTAANTTFTAQWTGTTYSSTLDFAAKTLAGETSGTLAEFLATGNMICSGIATRSAWETQTTDNKVGFWGYKLKDINATVKFMVQAGKRVTITLGSIGATTTLKKNGVSESVSTNSGDYKQNVITFDADVDMLVEIVVGQDNKTVTLNKIAIEDAIAATNVTVGSTGFATIGLPYATTLPEGVTAYAVSSVEGSKVVMSEAIAAGTVIPANRGLVIMADPNNSPYAFAEFVGTQQFDLSGNELKATGASAKAATAEGDFYYFAIINADKKKVGFKKCSATASLAANKAYLPGGLVGGGANALTLEFAGEATGINGIADEAQAEDAPAKVVKNGKLYIGNYNVAGQQVK